MKKIIKDVNLEKIRSVYIETSFDKGIKKLKEKGYELISLKENAKLRMQENDDFVSEEGNWVKEDLIYVPKKGFFLTKISPINENPEIATKEHGLEKEFYLTSEQVKKSLEDAIRINTQKIFSKDIWENKITTYVFGKNAEEYGKFLIRLGINGIIIDFPQTKGEKAFAGKIWFGGCRYGSKFNCCNDLSYKYGVVRGIKYLN